MKLEYRVLCGSSALSLEEQVVDLAQEGFLPQGGVAVTVLNTEFSGNSMLNTGMTRKTEVLYSQAMARVVEAAK